MAYSAELNLDHETSSQDAKASVRLWLRLLTCEALIEAQVRRVLQTKHDTTLPRFDLFAALHKAGGPLTMGELSRRLMVSNGNVTGLCARLEKEGLIVRTRAEEDRRTQYVALTRLGARRFEAMARTHENCIAELFSDISEDDVKRLMTLLANVKTSVRANSADAP